MIHWIRNDKMKKQTRILKAMTKSTYCFELFKGLHVSVILSLLYNLDILLIYIDMNKKENTSFNNLFRFLCNKTYSYSSNRMACVFS